MKRPFVYIGKLFGKLAQVGISICQPTGQHKLSTFLQQIRDGQYLQRLQSSDQRIYAYNRAGMALHLAQNSADPMVRESAVYSFQENITTLVLIAPSDALSLGCEALQGATRYWVQKKSARLQVWPPAPRHDVVDALAPIEKIADIAAPIMERILTKIVSSDPMGDDTATSVNSRHYMTCARTLMLRRVIQKDTSFTSVIRDLIVPLLPVVAEQNQEAAQSALNGSLDALRDSGFVELNESHALIQRLNEIGVKCGIMPSDALGARATRLAQGKGCGSSS